MIVHPNYADKHESNHQPQMHAGIVIKTNANQRYATTSATSTILKLVANKVQPPTTLQEFVVKNDSPCGSTIGPMLSAKLGLRTVDVGAPMLSMHRYFFVAVGGGGGGFQRELHRLMCRVCGVSVCVYLCV